MEEMGKERRDDVELKALTSTEKPRCQFIIFKMGGYCQCDRPVDKSGGRYCRGHQLGTKPKSEAEKAGDKVVRKLLRNHRRRFSKKSSLYDLQEEMAVVRATIAAMVGELKIQMGKTEQGDEDEKLTAKTLRLIKQLTNTIEICSKIAERAHKMEEGEKLRIDFGGIQLMINQVVAVIKKHVIDPIALTNISKDLEGLSADGRIGINNESEGDAIQGDSGGDKATEY